MGVQSSSKGGFMQLSTKEDFNDLTLWPCTQAAGLNTLAGSEDPDINKPEIEEIE